jgi:regulator of protease activity HflC (stomatin/prohibitin superfamily)
MYIVPQSHVALLYEDGVYKGLIQPGKHEPKRGFFAATVKRSYELVDLRERSVTLKGQEILTRDKVAIRVSLLVYFRVVDAEAALHNVADYATRIYEDVQLAARRFLASRSLESILNDRNEISDAVREEVKEQAATYGVEIRRADVKDLAFPGNLREIMNQVLETERKNEAKLIEAKKSIEAQRLKAVAENEAELARLTAQRERLHLELTAERERAEAELEKKRLELAAQVEEAEALSKHPQLLKLRELTALTAMAHAGGRFVIGIHGHGLSPLMERDS